MFSKQCQRLKKSLWYVGLVSFAVSMLPAVSVHALDRPAPDRSAWVTVAAATGFQGSWKTSYGPMTLRIVGDQVTGQYDNKGTVGDLRGTVSGSVVQGRWFDSKHGKGLFQFMLRPDGRSFSGNWTQDGHKQSGEWRGWR